jgi:SAM-dependent methyltransferase
METLPTRLLSVRLSELWRSAGQNLMPADECAARQKQELNEYAAIWAQALLLPGERDLKRSTLVEIGRWRSIGDLAFVRRLCEDAVQFNKLAWEQNVPEMGARQVEQYYDTADHYIDELMWWHTLQEDNSPLAYVAALEFALSVNCKIYLDFGSGVGSGALLFRRHGFNVALADISRVLLSFCKYRFEERGLKAEFVDLKKSMPSGAVFDFITAMDVFEHLVDPVGTVDLLHHCLKPGGYVYGRFAAEEDWDRPQHIVQDFRPVFDRFAELGFKEVFRDEWLWGHQAFQKPI